MVGHSFEIVRVRWQGMLGSQCSHRDGRKEVCVCVGVSDFMSVIIDAPYCMSNGA